MSRPFRYNKKKRKQYRKIAKAEIEAAENFEADGTRPLFAQFASISRTLADTFAKMSLAKRRKKKHKNSN